MSWYSMSYSPLEAHSTGRQIMPGKRLRPHHTLRVKSILATLPGPCLIPRPPPQASPSRSPTTSMPGRGRARGPRSPDASMMLCIRCIAADHRHLLPKCCDGQLVWLRLVASSYPKVGSTFRRIKELVSAINARCDALGCRSRRKIVCFHGE
jgi:hypothetical protein